MYANEMTLTPIPYGWAVELTGGRRIAAFHGLGARYRAERYLAEIVRLAATGSEPSSPDWTATC